MKTTVKPGTDRRSVIIQEAVLVALTAAALILSLLSSARGRADGAEYGVTRIGTVTVLCVLSAVFSVAAGVTGCVRGGTVLSVTADILRLAAAAFLMACFSVMVAERGDLMGYIWFSDLEAGNADANAALSLALASWIVYAVGVIWAALGLTKDFCAAPPKVCGAGVSAEAEGDA